MMNLLNLDLELDALNPGRNPYKELVLKMFQETYLRKLSEQADFVLKAPSQLTNAEMRKRMQEAINELRQLEAACQWFCTTTKDARERAQEEHANKLNRLGS